MPPTTPGQDIGPIPAPTNQQLADIFGFGSSAGPYRTLQQQIAGSGGRPIPGSLAGDTSVSQVPQPNSLAAQVAAQTGIAPSIGASPFGPGMVPGTLSGEAGIAGAPLSNPPPGSLAYNLRGLYPDQSKTPPGMSNAYDIKHPGKFPKPSPMTYQAMVSSVMQPYINALKTNPAMMNSVTNPEGGIVPKSTQETIANTLQSSSADYRTGLNAMLKTLPEQQGLMAEFEGIKSLIAYPYGIAAPPGITQSPLLSQIFNTIEAMRGIYTSTPSGSTGAASGYNAPLSLSSVSGG